MEYIGHYYGYQVYRNSQGFLEGYRTIWKHDRKTKQFIKIDIERIVTNTKLLDEFPKYFKPLPPDTRTGIKEENNGNQQTLIL